MGLFYTERVILHSARNRDGKMTESVDLAILDSAGLKPLDSFTAMVSDYFAWMRMPGPFAGVPMNSMPADSSAVFMAVRFTLVLRGLSAPASILLMVLVLTPDNSAKSETDILIAFRALLIWAAVIIDIYQF